MSAVHVVSETHVLRLFRLQDPSSEFSVTDSLNSLQYDIHKLTDTNAFKCHLQFYFFNHYFTHRLATPIWFYVI